MPYLPLVSTVSILHLAVGLTQAGEKSRPGLAEASRTLPRPPLRSQALHTSRCSPRPQVRSSAPGPGQPDRPKNGWAGPATPATAAPRHREASSALDPHGGRRRALPPAQTGTEVGPLKGRLRAPRSRGRSEPRHAARERQGVAAKSRGRRHQAGPSGGARRVRG